MQTTQLFPPFPVDLTPFFTALVEVIKNPSAYWHLMLTSTAFMAFQAILFFISVLFFAGIVYVVGKINETNKRINAKKKGLAAIQLTNVKSKRFEVVRKHMESENPAEWRLAIIEADSLLEEMVKRMGYSGTTLGEMLKNIEISDFTTLNDAWEAHKTRNQIAHQGSAFLLTKREAKRIVGLYENVFREFDII